MKEPGESSDTDVKAYLDKLENALNDGDFETAGSLILILGTDVGRMSWDDRDWYNHAKIGVQKRCWR